MSRAPDRLWPAPAETPAPVCVGVTAYRPNLDALATLLTVISQGGSKIWLFLNSPLSPDQKARLHEEDFGKHLAVSCGTGDVGRSDVGTEYAAEAGLAELDRVAC